MNTITINGKSFSVSGRNISVTGNKIYVDGNLVQDGLSGEVEIKFIGDLASLKAHNVIVEGNVHEGINAHNVTCEDVSGDIKAHNVSANNIKGSVNAKNVS